MKSLLLVLALCLVSLTAQGNDSRPRVMVETGALVGVTQDGISHFFGIPYAASPTGERRWTPPAPAARWRGDRDADQMGPACIQPARPLSARDHVPSPQAQSEDCLTLNVWAPSGARNLPVMVWLHGGAHRLGAGSLPYYNGSALARRGVLVVTFNYRLGLLGYFSAAALPGPAHGGNFGFMDELAALHWVQRNIAAFGGDPARVTVFGESAGAEDILFMMANPAAKGLFAGAIVESGGGWGKLKDVGAMQRMVSGYLERIGVAANADAETLRKVPAAKFADALAHNAKLGFGPFIDETSIRAQPTVAFAAGTQLAVPLIIGTNTWEGSLRRNLDADTNAEKLANRPAVRRFYPNVKDDTLRAQLFFGDVVFTAPARWIAAMQSRVAPAFLYRFGYVRESLRGKVPGVAHGQEIPYVFDSFGTGMAGAPQASAADRAMARDLGDCWVAFAVHGRPDCALTPWDAYDPARDNSLEIGNAGARQIDHARAATLNLIERQFGPDATR